MQRDNATLGTLLRHLIELLDGDVQASYDASSLNYRPRYTPVVRGIDHLGAASIRALANHAGLTYSAVSQTVAQMVRAGLVEQVAGRDGRERIVRAKPALTMMLPQLRTLWSATNQAAVELESALSFPLSSLLLETIRALEARPFRERIRDAEGASC